MSHKQTIVLALGVLVCAGALLALQPEPVDPVNWRELVPFCIDLDGWEAEDKASGQSMSMGSFKISQAERDYSEGDRSLHLTIVDGGYVPMVYAGLQMAMNFEIDSSEELVKKIEIKGFPGIERYDYDSRDAEVMLLVAERFMVQIEISDCDGTDEAKAAAGQLDLKGLAALAK